MGLLDKGRFCMVVYKFCSTYGAGVHGRPFPHIRASTVSLLFKVSTKRMAMKV